MKIGIYDPYLDTLTGGEKYMLSIASLLATKHAVSILWDPAQENTYKKEILRKFKLDLREINFEPNIFSPDTSFIKRFIASRKYDCIIYLSDGSIPLVNTKLFVHWQFPVEWVNANNYKTKYKASRIKKIICNSSFTKRYIDAKFGIQSEVLYPPVEIKNVQDTKKENIILHVGRFGQNIEGAYYKKQDVLIETFKKMIKSGLTGWRFVLVVGVRAEDTSRLEQLTAMAKGLPIEFKINPSSDELWHAYSSAKIYWHASGFGEDLVKHPEKAEHFGISTAEAMGAGAVPVVINAGGQPEIVTTGENGYLWSTTEECIEQTKKIMQDETFRKKLSENAKKRAELFNKENFKKNLFSIIV